MTKEKSWKLKAKLIGAGMIAGLLIGVFATLFVQNFNPPDKERTVTASVVFDRIIAQDGLVCASQQYNITDKATNKTTFFDICDIPFLENSFWYRYVGIIKVGVDLNNAAFSTNGNTIKVELDQPYIISNTPDMEKSGVLEENNNIFNPIKVENIDKFQRQCIKQSETEITAGGIFDEARLNAEQSIRDMFDAALGDTYNVEFSWREAEQNNEQSGD